MTKGHFISIIFFSVLLASCGNNDTVTRQQTNDKQSSTSESKDTVDNDFNVFIVKFSTDSMFQLSRIKFPLKISWHEIDQDTVMYKNKSDFELIDFRAKKYTGPLDQWQQEIIIDKNNKSATIEIRGIDNGIFIEYVFEKINGTWMFIEIDDSST
jgi:hypothetical protein